MARLSINYLTYEEQKQLLKEQLLQHQARLAHLKQNQTKFKKVPSKDSNEFGDYLILMGAIMREETYCNWLKECMKLSS